MPFMDRKHCHKHFVKLEMPDEWMLTKMNCENNLTNGVEVSKRSVLIATSQFTFTVEHNRSAIGKKDEL